MSSTKLIFTSNLDGYISELECFANDRGEITIRISDSEDGSFLGNQLVSLNVETAVKLSKKLKYEISLAKEEGENA